MKTIFYKPINWLVVLVMIIVAAVTIGVNITSTALADPPPTPMSFKDTDGDKPDTAGCVKHYTDLACGGSLTSVFADICLSEVSTTLFERVTYNNPGATCLANTCCTNMDSHQYDCYIWCRQQGAVSGTCKKGTTDTCSFNGQDYKAYYCSSVTI
mgnify:CR=1 FL=1